MYICIHGLYMDYGIDIPYIYIVHIDYYHIHNIYIYSVFYMGYITGYIDRSLRRLDRGWNRPSCYRTLRRAEKTQRVVGRKKYQ
jgi:hypothetical protein